jgi:ATP adenylyltransferase/5',5'''-P-1,P-4-tetraphosphate phosphorylase II
VKHPGDIDKFIDSQLIEWELASRNYKDLENVISKNLCFDEFDILVQFNPKRIISSSANVDARAIEARPCFLCAANRPIQQQGLCFKKDYTILVNPFPIFPRHLTIPHNIHTDQIMEGHFEDMLDLAVHLEDFVVFYNGPKCGASAPDHFHFQAGSKGFLPIEKDFHIPKLCMLKDQYGLVKISQWNGYFRTVITLQSSQKEDICLIFTKLYHELSQLQPEQPEPMMNIIAYVEKGDWVVHIFPRKLHRPRQYFEVGNQQLLLSPASVDLGGVLITPREEDFLKISKEDVTDILSQVSMTERDVNRVIKLL